MLNTDRSLIDAHLQGDERKLTGQNSKRIAIEVTENKVRTKKTKK